MMMMILSFRQKEIIYFCLLGFFTIYPPLDCGKVKVVEAPFSFNSPLGADPRNQDHEKKLFAKVDVALPSGPLYLIEKLNGECFSHMENNYKYEFCPYHNITQREQSYRWNSFHGILGIWREWKVINGTFQSMEFRHGDICVGALERQVSVVLKCGDESKILSVNEPETCKYKMVFKTPYACPVDVFQVYPILSTIGKLAWRKLEEEHTLGILTTTGYQRRMRRLMIKEGLIHKDIEILVNKQATNTNTVVKSLPKNITTKSARSITNEFISRHQCVQEYEKLFEEAKQLREKLKDCKTLTRDKLQHILEKNLTSTKVGKYRFGELGENRNKTVKTQQRISSDNAKNVDTRTLDITNMSKKEKRGETGFIDEEKFPSRHLQDRLHDNENI